MNLAEYETFRMMMIMKARERRMYRPVGGAGEQAEEAAGDEESGVD